MSDYGALSANGVGGGMKKDAFADAVQRAKQVKLELERTAGELVSWLEPAASLIIRDIRFSELASQRTSS